ncbi:MAG: hypothetical protein ACK5GN_01875 [Pseudomonadota bacterium]
MLQDLRRHVLEGLIGLSSLTFAAPARAQSSDSAIDLGLQTSSSERIDSSRVGTSIQPDQDKVLNLIKGRSLESSGCSFSAGSKAIGLHINISNSVAAGRPVLFADVALLFAELGREPGNSITRSFYESYARCFEGSQVRDMVRNHLESAGQYPELATQLNENSDVGSFKGPQELAAEQRVKIDRKAFMAIDREPVDITGLSFIYAPMEFQGNSQALRIHESISEDIKRGRPVSGSSIKALFFACSQEDIQGLGESFFRGYAQKFNSAEAVKIMIDSIIPVVDGKRALPRGVKTTPRLAALRVLGNSFPIGTSVESRRVFFESFRNESDLNVRALCLMMCINANINPQYEYQPSEIVRANQQLGSENRVRGDEFRLGLVLRDSLKKWVARGSIDAETLNQIKMPLLRRAATMERRHPGIAEALVSVSEDAYVDFLFEHAALICRSREAFSREPLLGSGEEFFALLHSYPEYRPVIMRDFLGSFGNRQASKRMIVKAEADPASSYAESAYCAFLSSLAERDRAVVLISSHGNEDGIFVFGGDAGEEPGTNDSQNEPLPTEFISAQEEAEALMQAGPLSRAWIFQSTCHGWDHARSVNEIIIGSAIKGSSIQQVVKELRLPGRIVAAQRGMRSTGLLNWSYGGTPENQRTSKTHESLLFWAIRDYSQSLQARRDNNSGEIRTPDGKVVIQQWFQEGNPLMPSRKHATMTPTTFTGLQMLYLDGRLADHMENSLGDWWRNHEGESTNPGETKGIDPSIQLGQLIDPDALHEEVLQRLRDRGYQIPEIQTDVKPLSNPADLIDEIG